MFKWYKLLHLKEIPPIYWMTLVYIGIAAYAFKLPVP